MNSEKQGGISATDVGISPLHRVAERSFSHSNPEEKLEDGARISSEKGKV